MGTLTDFDPAKAGFRVASPIRRKPRRPSTKPAPKPQYADAVWYSFREGTPLEAKVRTSAVADTVRRLKRAARYLERTHGDEVRVQISVEPVLAQLVQDGQPVVDKDGPVMVPAKPARSVVKFLGHKPFMLGRRISKARAEEIAGIEADAREAGAEAAAAVIAARNDPAPAHARPRRTVAGTRGQHAKTALQRALVWSVITAGRPGFPCGAGPVASPYPVIAKP